MWRRERECVCVRVGGCAWECVRARERERERESSGYSSSFPLIFFDTFLPVRCTDEQIEKKSFPKQHPDPILWRKLRLRNYFLNFWSLWLSPVVENGQLASNSGPQVTKIGASKAFLFYSIPGRRITFHFEILWSVYGLNCSRRNLLLNQHFLFTDCAIWQQFKKFVHKMFSSNRISATSCPFNIWIY